MNEAWNGSVESSGMKMKTMKGWSVICFQRKKKEKKEKRNKGIDDFRMVLLA